jgi:hypothetical protein
MTTTTKQKKPKQRRSPFFFRCCRPKSDLRRLEKISVFPVVLGPLVAPRESEGEREREAVLFSPLFRVKGKKKSAVLVFPFGGACFFLFLLLCYYFIFERGAFENCKENRRTHEKRKRERKRGGGGGGREGVERGQGPKRRELARRRCDKLYSLFLSSSSFGLRKNKTTMAIGTAPCAAAARPRLHSCRAAAPHVARQNAGGRRPAVSAAAAAPRAGGDSPTRNTTAAAAVFTADFAVSCPWPRPPSYQEPSPPASEQRLSIGSRLAIVVAKVRREERESAALSP